MFVETLHRVWKKHTRNCIEEDILRLLAPHPNFPALLPVAHSPDYFVVEFVPDRAIASWTEARRLVASLTEAVAYLHSCGYVHCDMKRENVRFTGNEAVLIDFDSAVEWRPGDEPLTGLSGSDYWRSPEAEAGAAQTDKIDIWGVGIVLMEEVLHLVTGGVYSGTCLPVNRLHVADGCSVHMAECERT